MFTKRLFVIEIYLKSHLHVCFVYLLTVMEKKKRFYSNFTSFEEKNYNQCIVNEKIKSTGLRIQLFDLLIFY